jgi:hypothetical protein
MGAGNAASTGSDKGKLEIQELLVMKAEYKVETKRK